MPQPTMKAAVVTGPNLTPIYADHPTPQPEPGQLLIHVRAAALTHLTKARASGAHYSAAGAYPAIAGTDGVGLTPDGRRVYFLLPEHPFGALAEFCPIDPSRTIPVPGTLSDVDAAALANPGMSCWAALVERAHLLPGESVLIHGATGAAGRIAVQVARHLGAGRIIATGRNPAELETLKPLGATTTLDLTAPTFEQALLDLFPRGIHVVLDYLWGPTALTVITAIARAVQDATPVRYVQVGSAAGEPEIALPAAALRSSAIQLMGSGLKAVPLPALLQSIERIFEIAAPANLQVETATAPLAQVEALWHAAPARPRLVFTLP